MVDLPDVNVLVAMSVATHASHTAAISWSLEERKGWATCPITEAGLVRVLAGPAYKIRPSIEETMELLHQALALPRHQFWPADLNFHDAMILLDATLVGYRQVTDAYLLALAIHHKGRLVTLDRGFLGILPEKHPHRSHIKFIPTPTN